MLAQLFSVILVMLVSTPGSAQETSTPGASVFDDLEFGLSDAAYLGLVIPLRFGLSLADYSPGTDRRPPAFDAAVRNALVWEHPDTAAMLSDVLLFGMASSMILSPPVLNGDVEARSLNGSLVAFEALLTTALLTDLLKYVGARQRPYAYFGKLDEGYASFFSGHTSGAFSAATMATIFAYEYEWLGDDTRWVIPVSTYFFAGLTGYLRMAADKHWLTDVLVGAAVGIGATYLTFALRTNE